MSDHRKNRPPQDAARINLNEEEEVRYWTKALGVTKEQLASAAKTTGLQVDAVRRHFAK